jgi:hypothetical protein
MLNLDLGHAETVDGLDGIRTLRGRAGHAVFGPYELLEAGRYAVEFIVRDADEAPLDFDTVVAVVDVATHSGQRTVAFDYVTPDRILDQKSIRLEFELSERSEVEYRVHVNGNRALLIADRPSLTSRLGSSALSTVDGNWMSKDDRALLKRLYEAGIRVDLKDESISIPAKQFAALAEQVLANEQNRPRLAKKVVHAVGWRGDDDNSLYRAFVGTEQPFSIPPQPVPFSSTLCQQSHFALDQYRFWAKALKETPRFQRKQWEFIFIAQVLYERGFLKAGNKGLVFGAGQEPLPSLFASFGVEILATDQAAESAVAGGWSESGQHTYDVSALNQRNICTPRMFNDLVSYRSVDMNDIPRDLDEKFDFCWSACAFEHLGSLQHGLDFVENSLRTLRPGGLAVHTTEYNISSNEDTIETVNTSIYRRRDIETFVDTLTNKGFKVAPIDWNLGEGFAETVVDLPPFSGRGEPHIRLRFMDYDTTSIGLIIQRLE